MNPALIIAAITAATEVVKYIQERRKTHELTPEEEAALSNLQLSLRGLPHWQPSWATGTPAPAPRPPSEPTPVEELPKFPGTSEDFLKRP